MPADQLSIHLRGQHRHTPPHSCINRPMSCRKTCHGRRNEYKWGSQSAGRPRRWQLVAEQMAPKMRPATSAEPGPGRERESAKRDRTDDDGDGGRHRRRRSVSFLRPIATNSTWTFRLYLRRRWSGWLRWHTHTHAHTHTHSRGETRCCCCRRRRRCCCCCCCCGCRGPTVARGARGSCSAAASSTQKIQLIAAMAVCPGLVGFLFLSPGHCADLRNAGHVISQSSARALDVPILSYR